MSGFMSLFPAYRIFEVWQSSLILSFSSFSVQGLQYFCCYNIPKTCESQVYIQRYSLTRGSSTGLSWMITFLILKLLLRRWRGCMSHTNLFKEPLCDLMLWAFDISEVLTKVVQLHVPLAFTPEHIFLTVNFLIFSSFCNQDMPRISPNFQVLFLFG